ncbi:uncharacterized protein LOC133324945 [Musca vetustissima]|uniref:uncharacterized protein LOC133324945 n=1 Tax=Musca vetustissima TaxID=27455 RepID=UPI002AB63176|nr:uncharacterized protein LOC133324945 [Musca vetustissima]
MIKIAIICGILLSVAKSNADECKKILKELANAEMIFAYCVTMHSVPVTICVGCREQYELMDANYTAFKDNSNCTAEYFDKDRVNLVAATEESLNKLWTKAYCDDCYRNDNLETFNNLSTALDGCLGQHHEDPCGNCILQYKELNNFYVEMDDHNNGKVCFDLQDSMNRTRNNWSKVLKCCRREFNMTLYTVALSIICALPILFYSATYFITKRQERQHGMLTDEDPLITTPSASSSSRAGISSNIPNNSLPTTSTPPVLRNNMASTSTNATNDIKTNQKINKLQDSDESSDEEVLQKPKYV